MSQTVQRAISIIEFIAEQARSLNEVAAHLEMHKSSALRLLQTLEANGFARRTEDGRYLLGTRFISLAQQSLDALDARHVAAPHLQRLHEACGHTIHLAQLVGNEIIYADKVEAQDAVRIYSRIGRSASLHASGVGKAILAFLDPQRLDQLLSGVEFTAHTSTTFTTRASFDDELDRIRSRGWAVDDGEFENFVNCIAAPIRDTTGSVCAAVSITSLKVIAPLPELTKLVPTLLATAGDISRELGYSG